MKNINCHLLIAFIFGLFAWSANALQVDKGKVILESLEDYQLCQKNDYSGDWCHEAMKDWVKAHPSDMFKAGKLTRRSMNAATAIYFFEKAFAQKIGDCKDSDVLLAVIAGLGLPKTSNSETVDASKRIGLELCYNEMKSALLKETNIGSYFFENTCQVFSEKGELQGIKQKKCKEIGK